MGDLDGPNKDGDYSWEKKHKRSWDVFEGDETVSLQRLVTSVQMQMRRSALWKNVAMHSNSGYARTH